jgi:hypothetical protein
MKQALSPIGFMRAGCIAYGVTFVLQANAPGLLAQMLDCVPHGTLRDDGVISAAAIFTLHDGHSLSTPEDVVLESPNLAAALQCLTQSLMIHVANFAPDRVFVHAGVIGWRARALILPGTSFAGKTTLVAALVRAGATYYSDEYAVVDRAGLVHPYTRDLQMREPGRPEQKSLPVSDLSGMVGVEALPIARVVFAQFCAGAKWQPEPVSAGLAVLEMLRHAIPVQRTPARVMATLAAMMQGATAWRSDRGDAAGTARILLAEMDR